MTRVRNFFDHPPSRQTLWFLVSVGLLYWGARGGASRTVIMGLFVLYAIAGTVWVRSQYEDSLDGRRHTLPHTSLIAIGVLAAGLGAAGWFREQSLETLVLTALILFFVGLGFRIVVLRHREDRVSLGRWALVAGGVSYFLGCAALGRAHWLVAAVLLVVALFLLPSGLAMLSEEAIHRNWRIRTPRQRLVRMTLGVVAFALIAVASADVADSPLVLLAFAAFGLLVVALTSSTMADVAAVLALVAFMGITPRQAALPPELTPSADRSNVLVALGDSYMSGEGAATFYERTDEGGGNGCRRSPTAWAAVAGQQDPFDGLDFLACSGASTYNVREPIAARSPGPETPKDPRPHAQDGEISTQLAQYQNRADARKYTPRLVVLSIGGNDAGFGTIGQMCVAPGNCGTEAALWNGGLEQVEESLRATYQEVRETFGRTPVAVIPYPDPIYNGPGSNCELIALSPRERTFIGEFLAGLNNKIRTVAEEFDFFYLVEMEGALANSGLQLCDPVNEGRPGLNFIGLRSVNGDPAQRFNPSNWTHNSLHPNERGHAAMLRVFKNWRDEVDPKPGDDPASAPEPGDLQAGADQASDLPDTTAACDVYGHLTPDVYSRADGEGCRNQGSDWALKQVGVQAGLVGVIGALAAAAAWTASAAYFGWRRARWPQVLEKREEAARQAMERGEAARTASGTSTASSADAST